MRLWNIYKTVSFHELEDTRSQTAANASKIVEYLMSASLSMGVENSQSRKPHMRKELFFYGMKLQPATKSIKMQEIPIHSILRSPKVIPHVGNHYLGCENFSGTKTCVRLKMQKHP